MSRIAVTYKDAETGVYVELRSDSNTLTFKSEAGVEICSFAKEVVKPAYTAFKDWNFSNLVTMIPDVTTKHICAIDRLVKEFYEDATVADLIAPASPEVTV